MPLEMIGVILFVALGVLLFVFGVGAIEVISWAL